MANSSKSETVSYYYSRHFWVFSHQLYSQNFLLFFLPLVLPSSISQCVCFLRCISDRVPSTPCTPTEQSYVWFCVCISCAISPEGAHDHPSAWHTFISSSLPPASASRNDPMRVGAGGTSSGEAFTTLLLPLILPPCLSSTRRTRRTQQAGLTLKEHQHPILKPPCISLGLSLKAATPPRMRYYPREWGSAQKMMGACHRIWK